MKDKIEIMHEELKRLLEDDLEDIMHTLDEIDKEWNGEDVTLEQYLEALEEYYISYLDEDMIFEYESKSSFNSFSYKQEFRYDKISSLPLNNPLPVEFYDTPLSPAA